jgi:hypothetical protein
MKLENKERIYAAILFILLAVFSISCLRYHLADFDIFINAAETLSQKGNIYGHIPANSGFNYYYSAFWAILLLPFIKYHTLGKAFWLLCTYFFYCRSFLLIKKHFPPLNLIYSTRYNIWIFLTLFLLVKMLIENTFGAQLTPFLLWGMLESLSLATSKNKQLLAGVLIGLLINVKIMPIIFLGYLAYRGYFKTVLACIATFIILLCIPSLFIGHTYNMFLLEKWWAVISPFNAEHNVETIDEGMRINLGALIPAYTMDFQQIFDGIKVKRNFINLNPLLVRQIITLGSLLLAGLSISFLRSFPFKEENNSLKKYWEASYFLLLIPLLMPHQQQYALLLALPLIIYLLYFYIFTFSAGHTKTYYCFLFVFIISALIFSPINGLDIIGGKAFSLLKIYKVISFATIALIPVALYCSPYKLMKILNAKNEQKNYA